MLKIDDESREFRKLKVIIDELDANKVMIVEIDGREPLNFKYLNVIVAYLKRKKIKEIFIQTSGLKLKNKDFLKSLIMSGITGLRIPIYGSTDKIHESITGHSGSFNDLVMSLDNLNNYSKEVKIYLHNLVLKKITQILNHWVILLSKNIQTCFSILDYWSRNSPGRLSNINLLLQLTANLSVQ